jgi:hypothetical protein
VGKGSDRAAIGDPEKDQLNAAGYLYSMKNLSTKFSLYRWGKKHYQALLAGIFILFFTISGIATLHNYGINWDEGLGNIFFGERNLYYFRTFDVKYLDFDYQDPYLDSLPINASGSAWRGDPLSFPPLFDTISAGSMHVFAYKLHWLDPIDGFHLPTVLFAATFLIILYIFISKRLDKNTALVSIILIGSFPRFFGDMHFNEKDVPEMIAFGLAVISYYAWFEDRTWKKAVLTGLLCGLAWAIKVNALFLPFIFILGIWKWNLKRSSLKEFWQAGKKFITPHIIMIIAAIHVFLLSWPHLWADPRRFFSYLDGFLSQGDRTGSQFFHFKPLLIAILTLPEAFLFFLLIGLGISIFWIFRKRNPMIRLALFWFLIPIFRICMPGAVNFDGIRHFLEFLPAAGVIAAFGIITLINLIKWPGRWMRKAIVTFLILCSVLNLIEMEVRYHPYEYLYYNSLAGSRTNVAHILGKDDVSDYWAISYRQGLKWLNANAVPNAYLYTPVAGHLVDITQRIWLRSDITPVNRVQLDEIHRTNSPIYVMFINRPAFFDDIASMCEENLSPVYELNLLDTTLMQVYRIDQGK